MASVRKGGLGRGPFETLGALGARDAAARGAYWERSRASELMEAIPMGFVVAIRPCPCP